MVWDSIQSWILVQDKDKIKYCMIKTMTYDYNRLYETALYQRKQDAKDHMNK